MDGGYGDLEGVHTLLERWVDVIKIQLTSIGRTWWQEEEVRLAKSIYQEAFYEEFYIPIFSIIVWENMENS